MYVLEWGGMARRLAVLAPPFGERHHELDRQSAKLAISRVTLCVSLRAGRPRAGDYETPRGALVFSKTRAAQSSMRTASIPARGIEGELG